MAAAGAAPDPSYPPDGMDLLPSLTGTAAPVEKVQAAPIARPKVPKRRRGVDCLVVDEGSVMELERRGWVTAVDLGQPVRRDEPLVQRKAAAFGWWHEPYKSRGLRTDL